jgi:hypothetical protein
MSRPARGEKCISGRAATLRSLSFEERIEIEWASLSRFFTFDQRGSQFLKLFVFHFEKAQTCFYNLAGAFKVAVGDLLVDEGVEIFFDKDGSRLPHGLNPVLDDWLAR